MSASNLHPSNAAATVAANGSAYDETVVRRMLLASGIGFAAAVAPPEGARVVDGGGRTLLPGLVWYQGLWLAFLVANLLVFASVFVMAIGRETSKLIRAARAWKLRRARRGRPAFMGPALATD